MRDTWTYPGLPRRTSKRYCGDMLQRVISGGQTGVDRAALDAAMACGIPHGGWCPLGRGAEDGVIPGRYQLQETSGPTYAERTLQNVLTADGTLVLYRGSITGGTALTVKLAERFRKPLCVVCLAQPLPPEALRDWLLANHVSTLNVAGPRESTEPGIYQEAYEYLCRFFQSIQSGSMD